LKKGKKVPQVLFVCVHNAGRSQMAEAFFNHLVGGKAVAHSAGTEPASEVGLVVREAMAELGIDIPPDKKPRRLTLAMLDKADRVITMGCMEGVCPATFLITEDWQLADPYGKSLAELRPIRDTIKQRVEALLWEITAI